MAEKSFTAMTNEGIAAVIEANRERMASLPASEPVGYPIALGPSDFEGLMWALQAAHDSAEDDTTADWAGNFASGIAETLGIEFI